MTHAAEGRGWRQRLRAHEGAAESGQRVRIVKLGEFVTITTERIEGEVLAEFPGGKDLERALRHRFAELKVRPGWFRHAPKFGEFVRLTKKNSLVI